MSDLSEAIQRLDDFWNRIIEDNDEPDRQSVLADIEGISLCLKKYQKKLWELCG